MQNELAPKNIDPEKPSKDTPEKIAPKPAKETGTLSVDPTTFEGDIIYGLRMVMGSEGSAKDYARKFAKVPNGIDLNPAALAAGVAVAEAIKGEVGNQNPNDIIRASGGQMDLTLSKIYSENGVVSSEPKTDIIVGPYNTTVKKKEGSQYASAQANEACAIMQAAIGPMISKGETQDLTTFLRQTMLKQSWAEIDETFKDNVEGMEKAAQKGASAHLGLDAPNLPAGYDYKKILKEALPEEIREKIAKEIEASSPPVPEEIQRAKAMIKQKKANPDRDFTKNPLTDKEIKEAGEEVRNELRILQASAIRSSVEGVAAKTTEVIKSNPGRIAILKECIQGNKKFEGPPETHAPSRLLVWSTNKPSSSQFVALDDPWFTAHGPDVKVDIRSRGRGSSKSGGKPRGGRWGVGGKRGEQYKENLQESLLFENVDPALLMYGYLLEGERWDKFKGAVKKALKG